MNISSADAVDCVQNSVIWCSRIFEILPVRIKDWQSSPCIADEKNRTALEHIRHQQLLAREKLLALDSRRRDLDALIERTKHLTVQHDADVSHSCMSISAVSYTHLTLPTKRIV